MAEGSRLFAEQLRLRRLSAGLSLSGLAKRVHYSKGHLSKVETGRSPAGMDLVRRCDAALGAEGRPAALVKPPVRASGGLLDERDEASEEVWTMNLGSEGSTWFAPVRRRDALTSGAALLALGLTERHASVAADHDSTLEAFRAIFEQHRLIGQAVSPAMVLPALIAQTHTLRGLAGVARSPVRERFLRLASRYAEYTGWMSQEAGNGQPALTRAVRERETKTGHRLLPRRGQSGHQLDELVNQPGKVEIVTPVMHPQVLAAGQLSNVVGQRRFVETVDTIEQDGNHPQPGPKRFTDLSTHPIVGPVEPTITQPIDSRHPARSDQRQQNLALPETAQNTPREILTEPNRLTGIEHVVRAEPPAQLPFDKGRRSVPIPRAVVEKNPTHLPTPHPELSQ